MNVAATRYFALTVLFLTVTAVASMLGMRMAVASTPDAEFSSVSSATCSFEPDVENIIYQTEALGVSLSVAEASTIHDALFVAGHASVSMNVTTTDGVKNVVVVSNHGALSMFDTNTGKPLPQSIRMVHTC